MYRNCHEHPEIAEILRNGERNEVQIEFLPCNCSPAVMDDLQMCESVVLSDEEYAEICAARGRA